MSLSFSLCILPNEMLLKIFEMCDVYTLLQLNSVCKRFNEITNTVLHKKSNDLLVTNEVSEKFRERCKPLLLSWNSKFNTYYNWRNKKYISKCVASIERIYTSNCLEMTRNIVWFRSWKGLYVCNRGEDGNITEDLTFESCESQLLCIAYYNDIIISGHENGSITAWRIESRNNKYIQKLRTHFNANNVINIEATTQHIISSTSKLIQIRKNIFEEDGPAEENEPIFHSKESVNSISLDPTGTKLAVSVEKLFLIYDINEKCVDKTTNEWIDDNSCFWLLWQDPHTILMLYRRHIKKMDTRNKKFVCTWDVRASFPDTYLALYSFSSDNLYTIITGTNNKTILWDQRQSNFIQTYDLCPDNDVIFNPVSSVQFDSTHMYAITRLQDLYELDFKGPILEEHI